MKVQRSRRWSRGWILGLFLTLGLAPGCGQNRATEVVADFATQWPLALVSVEPAKLDIGDAGTRAFLGHGWYHDERNKTTGDTFAWSRGRSSEVVFHLGWRRDLSFEFTCRPFQYPGAPPQTLDFILNGQTIGRQVVLQPSPNRISIDLPATAQVVGDNRLVIEYGRVNVPSTVVSGSTDQRELAVAWSEMVLGGVDDAPARAEEGAIEMPAGSRVDFFVEVAAGSLFRFEDCRTTGSNPAIVEVSILGEFDEGPESHSWTCSGGPGSVPLNGREGLTRLRLTTHPEDDDVPPTGIRFFGAMILSPPVKPVPGSAAFAGNSMDGPPPNVIIYLVDALRSDRLGVYGCDRPLSPRLDAMAVEGITFTDMVAQSSWTKAAVASIFTGLWPRAHGVNGPDDRLPEALTTLPEHLQSAGYQTGAVVANAYVGRPFGFARGFDHFEFIEHTRGRSEVIHERVASWLDARNSGEAPFFLYVHTIDPHAPYAPPSPFLETFASAVRDPSVGQVETVRGLVLGSVEATDELAGDLRDLYDAEVAANDASFGRLLDTLEALGELENTVVIFTSDHGEAFGEHKTWTHGLDLYNEVLSVPLVVRLPGAAGAGQRISIPVQHIDLLPTILSLCGIDSPTTEPGEALVERSGEIRVGEDRTIFAFLDYWGRIGAAAYRDGWKIIQPLTPEFGSEVELYRHDQDRAETVGLAVGSPVRRGWLLAQLKTALEGEGTTQTIEVDAETREQLEALGYMN